MASQRRRLTQKGVSLLVGTASMALLIPSAGLAIDAALLYYTKARIQGAVDGAALAAARSLSLGATTTAQSASVFMDASLPRGTRPSFSITCRRCRASNPCTHR